MLVWIGCRHTMSCGLFEAGMCKNLWPRRTNIYLYLKKTYIIIMSKSWATHLSLQPLECFFSVLGLDHNVYLTNIRIRPQNFLDKNWSRIYIIRDKKEKGVDRKSERRTRIVIHHTTTEWGIGWCLKWPKTSAILRPGVKDPFNTGS